MSQVSVWNALTFRTLTLQVQEYTIVFTYISIVLYFIVLVLSYYFWDLTVAFSKFLL